MLKVSVKPLEVFPDEPIRVQHILFTRGEIRYEGFVQDSKAQDFWIETFPLDANALQSEKRLYHEKEYLSTVIRRQILFPMHPGIHVFHPGSIQVAAASWDNVFDNREKNLKSFPFKIRVKPFPKDHQPLSFSGSSGVYTMDGSLGHVCDWLWKFKIVIKGSGNLRGVNPPVLNLRSKFKILKRSEETHIQRDFPKIFGKKSFTFYLEPTVKGEIEIPPVYWSYYDIRKHRYETLIISRKTVHVNELRDESPGKPGKPLKHFIYVMDLSGSMFARDLGRSRFEIAKDAVQNLSARQENSTFSLTAFAGNVAFVRLKSSRTGLLKGLDSLNAMQWEEGSAVANALYDSLNAIDPDLKTEVILVTDATRDNASQIELRTVARRFAEKKIPIHVISIYANQSIVIPMLGTDGFAKKYSSQQVPLFKAIASMTKGEFYHIQDL